jgi:hypothetical protein
MFKWPWWHIVPTPALIQPVIVLEFVHRYSLAPLLIAIYCVVAGQAVDPLEAVGAWRSIAARAVLLGQDILL